MVLYLAGERIYCLEETLDYPPREFFQAARIRGKRESSYSMALL
jgi:hypothetical protein